MPRKAWTAKHEADQRWVNRIIAHRLEVRADRVEDGPDGMSGAGGVEPEEEPAQLPEPRIQAREDGTRPQHHPKLPVDLRYKWSLLSQQSWDLLFPGLDGIIPNDHEVEGPQPVHLALLQLPIHLVLPAVYSRGEHIASQLVDDYPRLQFFNPQVAWTEFIEGPNSSMRKEPDWTYCALHAKLSLYLKPRRALEFWVANGHLGLDEQGTHFLHIH